MNGSVVKVYFLWDWCGKKDGFDLMWVCVLQLWVGDGWGVVVILWIKQEVLVVFNQGDLDNFVIVGCVFNGEQGNLYYGVVGQMMGIKSQMYKGQGLNELLMSDVNGVQMFYMYVQKDMYIVVEDVQWI